MTYYGAYQFALTTYQAVGGTGIPSQQPPGVQDYFAWKLYLEEGWSPWQCARMLGYL